MIQFGWAIAGLALAMNLLAQGSKESTEVNERGSIRIDASKKPTAIDFVVTEGKDRGKTQLGILEVSGDTLRASLGTPGEAQRPTDFNLKDGVITLAATRMKR